MRYAIWHTESDHRLQIVGQLARLLQNSLHFPADFGWTFYDVDPRRRHRVHLLCGVPFAAGDDRAGVSHATSGRRRLATYEADHGLVDVLLDVFGGLFFR